jgi:hypothetical protein
MIDKTTFKPGLPEMTVKKMMVAAAMNARGKD